jgi:hypothetical protein
MEPQLLHHDRGHDRKPQMCLARIVLLLPPLVLAGCLSFNSSSPSPPALTWLDSLEASAPAQPKTSAA